MVYPFKSRVASLEVGDIFSFSESEIPDWMVTRQDHKNTFYSGYGHNSTTQSISRYSNRIILILGKKVIIQFCTKTVPFRYKYRNKQTGDEYRTLKDASADIGFSHTAISKSLNGKRNKKIPIEKIRSY